MAADDPWNLDRFVRAQAGVFETALEELQTGRKRSHWMWFIFPQLKGLGASSTAQHYGLAGVQEAHAYLGHPLLERRLQTAVEAVQGSPADSLHALFGAPDDLKFRSCMTLFAAIALDGPYSSALDRWCGGKPDARTLALLRQRRSPHQGGEVAATPASSPPARDAQRSGFIRTLGL